MKVQNACFSLAAIAVVMASPSHAADWSDGAGSIKDMGGPVGVPVPAPVPIPDYKPSFYFRIDAGYGRMKSPSVSESGYQYGGFNGGANFNANGSEGAASPTLLSNDPSWLNTDFSDLATYGAGVGAYLGSGWRIDATLEGRSKNEVDINGTASWTSYGFNTPVPPATATLTSDLNGDTILNDRTTTISLQDKTSLTGSIWMANLYYDLMSHRAFTPYIGAGIGFVWNEMSREHTTTVTSAAQTGPCLCTTDYTSTTSDSAETVSLAAAAMAGMSYQISDITSVDVGYRFLYIGGTGFDTTIDGFNSHISFGDQFIHQVRAGLRFDVN